MNKHFVKLSFLWLLALGGAACSQDELSTGAHPKGDDGYLSFPFVADVQRGSYVADLSRARSSDWTPGDSIFFNLSDEGFRSTAFAFLNSGSAWQFNVKPDDVSHFENSLTAIGYHFTPAHISDDAVSLNHLSCIYRSDEVELTIRNESVVLNTSEEIPLDPMSGRIRFLGDAGSQFTVVGLSGYTAYSRIDGSLSDAPVTFSAVVDPEGTSPYFYNHFPDGTRRLEVAVSGCDSVFYRQCGEAVLREGHAGKMNLPTRDSHVGWSIMLPGTLEVSNDSLSFDKDMPSPLTLRVIADNQYAITSSDWVTVTSTDNVNWTVTAAPLTDVSGAEASRTGEILITMPTKYGIVMTKRVKVLQYAKESVIDRDDFGEDSSWDNSLGSVITVPITALEFNYLAQQSDLIAVYADFPYTIASSEAWLTTASVGTYGFVVIVTENAGANARTGTITLSMNDDKGKTKTQAISVTQTPKLGDVVRDDFGDDSSWNDALVSVIRVPVSSITFNYRGQESQLITVDADFPYTISDDEDWISTMSVGNDGFIIKVTEYTGETSRTGAVTLSMPDDKGITHTHTITVTQTHEIGDIDRDDFGDDGEWDDALGSVLDVPVDQLSFNYQAQQSASIVFYSDNTVTLSTSGTWLSAEKQSETSFIIKVTEYTGDTSRTGTVTVKMIDDKGQTKTHTINVIQTHKVGDIDRDDFGNDEDWNFE